MTKYFGVFCIGHKHPFYYDSMGYLYIKSNYDKNTFTGLEFSNLTFFLPKKYVLKNMGKVKF